MTSPLVILVASSVVVGVVGSIFILLAISVNSWEETDYDDTQFTQYYTNNSDDTIQVTPRASKNDYILYKYRVSSSDAWQTYFLYYEYGGAWRLCDTLSDSARSQMSAQGVTRDECYNFVSEYDEESTTLEEDGKSIARLQNSGASCFIVSIIDLVAAAGVGVITLTQKQVAAGMVTGVLYCMASLFTVFGLIIFHVKHHYEKYNCQNLYPVPPSICNSARTVTLLWAVPVAWVGVVICLVASVLWLLLTRALRVIKAKTML
ncbi:hypothetical protein FSP39_024910 [Pinctada imbricata]|uniref:Uncharacterized protein n=1 Tax=Pinctada imbricata TaxID=66713 RepID=A0AA88Y9M1_PINIB|nr:hypothetical protein FSP39_024910 [Pinctada imbricata]